MTPIGSALLDTAALYRLVYGRFAGLTAAALLLAYLAALALASFATPGPFAASAAAFASGGGVVLAAIAVPLLYAAYDLYARLTTKEAFALLIAYYYERGPKAAALSRPVEPGALKRGLSRFRRYLRAGVAATLAVDFALLLLTTAAFTWGLAAVFGADALFAGVDDAARPGFGDLVAFWAGQTVDLVLLDAPSTFGWRLSALEARPDAEAFLTLVFIFRLNVVVLLATTVPFLLGRKLTPFSLTPRRISDHLERSLPEIWAADAQAARGATEREARA